MESPDTVQSDLDEIEEVRAKIQLKEKDAKACYESSEARKLLYGKLIAKLRAENKEKRVQLANSVKGDEKVIRTVFNNRREALLSMQRCSIGEAIYNLDQKICKANNRRNKAQFQLTEREGRCQEMEKTLNIMKQIDAQEADFERKREIRRLQNDIDKAKIKYEAARNITRRYEEIMRYMEEESRLYPARLDKLQSFVVRAKRELSELRHVIEKALYSKEEAKIELHIMERDTYQAKKARDAQLNEAKREVEKRKEPVVERAEKRAKVNIIMDSADLKPVKSPVGKRSDRQEHLLTLNEGIEKIKRAFNVSDIKDIVYRVTDQDSTHRRLIQQQKEKQNVKARLQEEREKLNKLLDEMKYTSQRQLARGRKMVEELQEFVVSEEKMYTESMEEARTNEKLLIDLQFGINTLYDKLSEVKLKPPYHNYSKGDPVDDLANCSRKLELLVREQADIPKLSKASDQFKLHAYLESQLSPENFRIRIDPDDGSDDDAFQYDGGQDNEGHLTRDDIKRLGDELLNSKLQPKKKKGRKHRN
ncbi:outer dynein arm-docking complex subunit 3-like [Ostrea edulis]|uniref:outer dynein arm-docking complex subunit 3-like n=1 Tax=Ostrea edulis TaxID=37623 RepID=UPI0024AF3048|nr:outer dynein arm-docking complex subunit 3-like [Ostrea edulis]